MRLDRENYAKYVDHCLVNRVAPMRYKQWKKHVERCIDHLEFTARAYRMKKENVVRMVGEKYEA